MKTILITLLLAVSACFAFGQTTLNGPVTIVPPKGGSPTFILDLVPAAPNFPCVAAPAGYYAICGQSNAITVDFGDGKGFVSLKGDKGDPGAQGPQGSPGQSVIGPTGPQGLIGATGPAGTPWSLTGKTFSIKCAWGGHGVPQFNVMGCTITQQ